MSDELKAEIERLHRELAREEQSHSNTIDARDLAEEALSEIWSSVFGGDPRWSNLYGFSNAVNDIDAEVSRLRARVALLESVLAEAKRECIMTPFCAAKIVATDAAQENGK